MMLSDDLSMSVYNNGVIGNNRNYTNNYSFINSATTISKATKKSSDISNIYNSTTKTANNNNNVNNENKLNEKLTKKNNTKKNRSNFENGKNKIKCRKFNNKFSKKCCNKKQYTRNFKKLSSSSSSSILTLSSTTLPLPSSSSVSSLLNISKLKLLSDNSVISNAAIEQTIVATNEEVTFSTSSLYKGQQLKHQEKQQIEKNKNIKDNSLVHQLSFQKDDEKILKEQQQKQKKYENKKFTRTLLQDCFSIYTTTKTASLSSSCFLFSSPASFIKTASVFLAAAAFIVHLQRRFYGLNKYSWIFLLIYLNFSAKFCMAGYHEKRLLHDLLDPYNTLERPVLNESDPLQLSFGLTLMQIIDVDEKNQLLITNVWLKLEWNDMNLRWNTSEYGGVKDLRIPPHRIWKPDVLMYNSADEGFDGTYQTNVVVRNNGSCLYVPPGIFKSTCKIDITWFPFDDQRCEMKFGSWTYDGFQLDLQLQDEAGGDISSYVLNGEWELLGVPGKRNEIYYNCCPEPYIDITFAIIIRRRTLYYFFNLIVPCVLIASMALLGFTLPPDSGEKLSLGVTILLSLTVFLNMVAETMPATSDAVPLLGTYFNCIMFMVASSVVSTILILNYHHRNADTHEMSEWIRIVFLCWLPWILRMHRPGRPLTLEFPPTPCSDTSSERKHQILSDVELKERSSKSLLANVLDIDDDFRHNCRPLTPGGTLPHNPAFYRTVYSHGDDGSIGPIGSTRMPDAVTQHTCIKSTTDYELGLILKEIRFITDQLRKEDEENEIANDWKFAAMVVDRLCLIIFTLFTILATIAVLFSAPHIIVS